MHILPSQARGDHGPCVLIVDDDVRTRAALRACLENRGFAVHAVGSGAEAVELFRQMFRRVVLVLLDVGMPCMDGIATLARLREITLDVPCCLMIRPEEDYSIDELHKLGANAVLSKPFDALTFASRWQRSGFAAVG